MRPYSIVRRMIGAVLVVELAAALCVTTAAFFYERHIHFRAFDVLLRGRADSILGAVQDADDAGDNVMMDGSQLNSPAEDVYEVEDASGRLLGRSPNWEGEKSLRVDSRHVRRGRDGDDDVEEVHFGAKIGGQRYGLLRISGVRVVDPGDPGGGVRHNLNVVYGMPVDRVWNAVMRSVSFYAVSSLLVMALTAALMLWLLHRGLLPLRELAAAASRVSVNSWEFTPPESAQATQELAPLTQAMHAVLMRLRLAFEQQQRFVGDAGHELKTGVALVKSSLQLIGVRPRSQNEYINGLERCLVDCERMEAMVAQMLTLARIEESTPRPQSVGVTELRTALREVMDELETMAELRQVHLLVVEAPGQEQPLSMPIEPEQFKLLCSNVLMNAVQHSMAGSTVQVLRREDEGFVEIEFRDRGDGIGASELPYVFERFSRGDPSRSRHSGGTGLGLAICKAIVDKAGGSIRMESEVGMGTNVFVRLPLMRRTGDGQGSERDEKVTPGPAFRLA